MKIVQIEDKEKRNFMYLLLIADKQINMINIYIRGKCLLCMMMI